MRLTLWLVACPAVACVVAKAEGEPREPKQAAAPKSPAGPTLAFDAAQALDIVGLPWADAAALERIRAADSHLEREEPNQALATLGDDGSQAAVLLRARAWRLLGNADRAIDVLDSAEGVDELAPLVALERGLAAWQKRDAATAVRELLPLIDEGRNIAQRAALPLCEALAEHQPQTLMDRADAIEKCLPSPRDDLDARSLWLDAQARALDALGRGDDARSTRLRRYLEEPVSLMTPANPPDGTEPTQEQLLSRAEILLDAHRNERVLAELGGVSLDGLTAEQRCRVDFALGLASRKLRRYATAEKHLTRVVGGCADEQLVRRAMYLQAKVISIRDGLRAVPVIEQFAKRFAGHSMVDDVLFWAGDMYQRRSRWPEATAFYRRIGSLPVKGDYCGEARWRLAWIAFRRGRHQAALAGLGKILDEDGCAPESFDRARARYWMARIHELAKRKPQALQGYRDVTDSAPLGFYGQLSLARMQALDEVVADEVVATLQPPAGSTLPALCPGFLAREPAFSRGVRLMLRGLNSDAASELLSIHAPDQDVLGKSHAVNLGLEAKPAEAIEAPPNEKCPRRDPLLLLALLLDQTGAHRDAHWRLRTDFKETLATRPSASDGAVWRAAYPLAYRDQIAPAEKEAGLPALFLQALSREESALDPRVVSWAGAYGLTQLLLSSGRAAGKLLDPPVAVSRAEDLLEPEVNARLGAALLASEVRALGDNLALGLAAYNAGHRVAVNWWKRHQGGPFDTFAEEMTIKETRGYVKRVLKTYGTYRWLYAAQPPILPVALTLPKRD